MPVRYEPNPLYMQEIEAQEQFIKGRHSVVKEVLRFAKLFAPVRNTKYKRRLPPGVYRRRLEATLDAVVAADPYWHWIEYGSVHNTPRAPLRRAARAAGLRLVTVPKHS